MAGLLNARAPQPQAAEGEAPNVTPEEQAQYDAFVNNAYKIIYSEKTFPEVLERLRAAAEQDAPEGLAATTVMVVVRVQESAKRNGKPISPDVVFHAGVEILESLADTAEKAGIHKYDEKEIEAASLRAMDLYRETATKLGLVDQEAAKRDFAAIQQADKAGKLDEMMPGVVDRYAPIGEKALQESESSEAPAEGRAPADEAAADPQEMRERRGMLPRGRR